MATYGDEKNCGGYIRRYYDSQWDLIISEDDKYFWRDKFNHVTYECKTDVVDELTTDQLGEIVDKYNDDDENGIWDEDEEEVEASDENVEEDSDDNVEES